MEHLFVIFCFCVATAGWVASAGSVARRESDSNCSHVASDSSDGVFVTVNVNGVSRCGNDRKTDCCADVRSRLAAVEQHLQQISKNTTEPFEPSASATPTTTPTPERDPLRSCRHLNQAFYKSGVYTIDPNDGDGPIEVYCDMETDGGGWAVFQRREDGSLNFYRDWVDYKNGFGDLNKEFWLGLDKISRITKASSQTMRVDMTDSDEDSRYAQYKTFDVGNEASGYVLRIGLYSGNAGDSLNANGVKFSTKDKDQDTWRSSCALKYKGGWWYQYLHSVCHYSNLNGIYRGGQGAYGAGINWKSSKGHYYSLKFTEMKMRPE
ncbi:ryncolin-1-like [Oscarella lobularis]|uniref:ryncolin-1-like n=1 Tax=Oscarella lobularis TaxID=121494 RepID=UPI00331403C9